MNTSSTIMNKLSTLSTAAAVAAAIAATAAVALALPAQAQQSSASQNNAQPKPSPTTTTTPPSELARFDEVAVGVAVSASGRVFVAFSRAIDPAATVSVAEVKGGKPVAYPPGLDQADGWPAKNKLLAVQALAVDAKDRLWLLDSGKVGTNRVEPDAPKLIAVDLATDKVVQTIVFPKEIAGPTSFLNDVVVDVGADTAYITDASPAGPNGIVVVDLKSGTATRRLNDHKTTKPDKGLLLKAQGQQLLQKKGPTMGMPFLVGTDGIALSADGAWLFYSPLTSHKLHRVSTAALRDTKKADAAVVPEDLGDKGFAADGMMGDAQNRLYVTDFENSRVQRRSADGKWETIVQAPELDWPDSLAIAKDGRLIITTTQIQKSPRFLGLDKRKKPFVVYEVQTDSTPLLR